MNEIKIFNYNNNEVRVIEQNGEPWFIAKDVCEALGLEQVSRALRGLKKNDSRLLKVTHPQNPQKKIEVNVVSEPGLYKLIFKSRKPEAEQFQDWVYYKVLPDIRKHGMYLTDKAMEAFNNDPEAFKHIVKKYTELHEQNQELKNKIEADRPFVLLGQIVLADPNSMTLKDASDLFAQHGIDIGQNRFFQRCRKDRMLCSRKGRQWNKPTRKAIERGLFNIQITGGNNTITMITPKGLQHYGDVFMGEEFPLLALTENQEETEK